MKRKIVFITLIIFVFISCKKIIDYNPSFEGGKMNINGFIDIDKGIFVKVTHTQNPVRTSYLTDSNYINNAIVIIYKNNDQFDTLTYNGKGIYKQDTNRISFIEEDAYYNLKVISDKYGIAESYPVQLPKKLQFNYLNFKKMEELSAYNTKYGKLSISFDDNKNSKDSYYLYYTTEDINTLTWIGPLDDNITYITENCYVSISNWLVFKDECMSLETDTLDFRINLQSYGSSPLFKKIKLTVGISNHNLWDYAKSMNDLSGFEYGYAEPKILYSNIIGGYGLFYASSEKQFVFNVESNNISPY